MKHSVKSVKYTGIADNRIISEGDWAAIDVRGQSRVEWNAANDFTISGDEFVDGAIAYFERDDEFVLTEEKTTA